MRGSKEFHQIIGKIIESEMLSLQQFKQLCKDTQYELNTSSPSKRLDIMEIYERYYTMNWGGLDLLRLADFIKKGKYCKELEIYEI
jgi:hypothetical protein